MNQQPITITTTRAVWISEFHSVDRLMDLIERGQHGSAADLLTLWGDPKEEDFGAGYTRIGDADVTIRLIPRDQQAALAIATLNKKLDELRRQYLEKQQEILERINKLQALPMPEVVEVVELGTDPA